jgi:hypothetical protein
MAAAPELMQSMMALEAAVAASGLEHGLMLLVKIRASTSRTRPNRLSTSDFWMKSRHRRSIAFDLRIMSVVEGKADIARTQDYVCL